MSPHEHRVSSFVGDLVEMARSHEELPKVREELQEARVIIDDQAATIQRLELKLIERANELQDKLSQIRAAEVARDDAELRFLEAEDRTEKAVAFVRTVFGNAGQLIQALEPPKPEPVPSAASEPQAEVATPLPNSETGAGLSSPQSADAPQGTGSSDLGGVSGERAADPIPAHTQDLPRSPPEDTSVASVASISTEITGTANVDSQTGGVSVSADPTASSPGNITSTAMPEDSSQTVEPMTAKPQSDVSSEPSGPYSDRKYYDYPGHVSLEAWLAGGGTEASYRWRPWNTDAA